jgi:predicted SAM-dependent methyltransferase
LLNLLENPTIFPPLELNITLLFELMINPNKKAQLKESIPFLRNFLHFRARFRRKKIINTYLQGTTPPSLHLGCGNNVLAGWLNTDLLPNLSSIVLLDVTRRFPFSDHTFDRIYTEHMIEHIPFEAAHFMLVECRRIMRPGGVIRIATPDIKKVIGLYPQPHSPEVADYLAWSRANHSPNRIGDDRCHVINSLFYGHGHRFLYDDLTLSSLLTAAGFKNPSVQAPSVSNYPDLWNIEHHGGVIGESHNRVETLVVEATG